MQYNYNENRLLSICWKWAKITLVLIVNRTSLSTYVTRRSFSHSCTKNHNAQQAIIIYKQFFKLYNNELILFLNKLYY